MKMRFQNKFVDVRGIVHDRTRKADITIYLENGIALNAPFTTLKNWIVNGHLIDDQDEFIGEVVNDSQPCLEG